MEDKLIDLDFDDDGSDVESLRCSRETCRKVISMERVSNAKKRGCEAKWCSSACSSAGNAAAYYGRMHSTIAERRAKIRKSRGSQ